MNHVFAGRIAICAMLLASLPAWPADGVPQIVLPAHGVIGVSEAQLSPDYWSARLASPDRLVLDRAAIDVQNARLYALDDSMHVLPIAPAPLGGAGARILPLTLDGAQVRKWIVGVSRLPSQPVFDERGQPVSLQALGQLQSNVALDAIPGTQPTRFGLVVARAALRSFPGSLRVFNENDDRDIDRFQESALFTGTPVVIAHRSRDRQWLFVVSANYAAWTASENIAEGSRESVQGYLGSAGYRVVTGARVATVFTPEEPRVSELPLEMGTRLPLADVQDDLPVNGQHPYTSWPLQLPVRAADGSLSFVPALLQKNADSAPDYLPLTPANLIRQSFKFLGERYGWGHSYDGRDCSGFVSEVYRSMGVELPRNTSDQGTSPALDRLDFTARSTRAQRKAAAESLDVGDLVYIPGHVMMVIGRVDGEPYVIHDTSGGSYLDADGKMRSMHLNAVSVTPLLPLRFNIRETYVDRMTHIVRIRPLIGPGNENPKP